MSLKSNNKRGDNCLWDDGCVPIASSMAALFVEGSCCHVSLTED